MENTKKEAPKVHNDSTVTPKELLPGVFRAQKKDGSIYYRSSLTYKNRHISLGSFETEEAAHKAYLEGKTLLDTPQVKILHFERFTNTLSFEKWVILLNFRDHGIYFSTPIYMGQKMFYYYLSPEDILKFDLEDLFYFSSHKIMRRGGHLFVADYGSQISIISRYGLKAYSVEGQDFAFRNGDPLDFRRENLDIKNTYHGVSYDSSHKKYRARVHIKSYYQVGDFDSGLEAAIAYNKAVDYLKKQGFQNNFLYNEIYEIPASKYATIYAGIQLKESILQLTAHN